MFISKHSVFPKSHICVRINVGVRFFRFEDMFAYDTADVVPTVGTNPDDEVFYQIDIKNDLVGVQPGCLAEYDVSRRFRCFADGKFGMYGNHISHRSTVSNCNGVGVVGPGNPTTGALFDINSKKDDFSFLAALELGADWHFNPCWSARVGYRVVAVTGVAHTVEQIPVSFADVGGVADIDSNGHLILHGFHASVEKHW